MKGVVDIAKQPICNIFVFVVCASHIYIYLAQTMLCGYTKLFGTQSSMPTRLEATVYMNPPLLYMLSGLTFRS